jgi:hypothetical protein
MNKGCERKGKDRYRNKEGRGGGEEGKRGGGRRGAKRQRDVPKNHRGGQGGQVIYIFTGNKAT